MSEVITVKSLRKCYGETVAVDGVSLAVEEGEIFGILGKNGAGKTTTVEILQGLRRRDGGSVSVLGLDPATSAADLRKHIGSQLQSSALPARITVREALDLFASFAERPVTPDTLIRDWDLADFAGRQFGKLSGGQQQRLFLALALINDPKVVFLDELTTGLDPHARRQTWQLVERVRSRGATVVLVSHYMEEAQRLCDRLVILANGQVAAEGTTESIVATHTEGAEVRFAANGHAYSFLGELPSVRVVQRSGEEVVVTGDRDVAFDVAGALHDRGLRPIGFQTRQPTLEDAFLAVTEVR